MKKEGILAIVLGSILGLVIAFGIWRTNQSLSIKQPSTSTAQPSGIVQTPNPQNNEAQYGLTIAKPEDEDVLTNTAFELVGVTKPDNFVVIQADDQDFLVKADARGGFSQKLDANGGANNIKVISIDANGSSQEKTLVVVYTSKLIPTSTQTQTGTSSATLDQKVQQKVNEALNKPKAYIGTITDITDSGVQIKSPKGEVKQISLDKATTYAKIGKVTADIEFADMAIGDAIIAMGYKNGSVLGAKRILVNTANKTTPPSVVIGKITNLAKKQLTLSEIGKNNSWTVTSVSEVTIQDMENGKAAEINFSDLSSDSLIVIIGNAKDNAFTARSIFVINAPTPSPSPTPATKK